MEIKREHFSDDEIIDKVLIEYYHHKDNAHNLFDVLNTRISLSVNVTESEYKHIEDLMLMYELFTVTEINPDRLYKISNLGKKIQRKNGWLKHINKQGRKKVLEILDLISNPILVAASIVTIFWNIYTSKSNERYQQELKQTTDSTKQVLQDLDLRYKTNIEKTEQLRIKVDSLAMSDTAATK